MQRLKAPTIANNMNDTKKSVKGRRGPKKATGVRPNKQKVTFEELAPSGDRVNVAFCYKYKPKETLLREGDKAFFKFYHEHLPYMLNSYNPWAKKAPSSRVSCKCKVYEISSFAEIVTKLKDFLLDNRSKKIGTIFISGHGSRKSLSIPVAPGAPIISVDNMVTGLENAFNLNDTPPPGWNQSLWDQCRPGFERLDIALATLQKIVSKQFDEHSLIRFWVCFLGVRARNLEIIGRLIVPHGKVTIEAPKVRSVCELRSWGGPGAFRNMKRKNYMHPDIAAEVLSNSTGTKFTGEDRKDAIDNFDSDVIQTTRVRKSTSWYPVFGLEYKRDKYIYQGKYKKFRKYWTTVRLK